MGLQELLDIICTFKINFDHEIMLKEQIERILQNEIDKEEGINLRVTNWVQDVQSHQSVFVGCWRSVNGSVSVCLRVRFVLVIMTTSLLYLSLAICGTWWLHALRRLSSTRWYAGTLPAKCWPDVRDAGPPLSYPSLATPVISSVTVKAHNTHIKPRGSAMIF